MGFTTKSLSKLQTYEMRQFRAIARSPVRLTRESNDIFLRRLSLVPIQEYFKTFLQGRIKKCQNETIQQYFARVLNFRIQDSSQGMSTSAHSEILLPVAQSDGVSCPTCGMYFLDQASMRKHHAKKHKVSLVNPDRKDFVSGSKLMLLEQWLIACLNVPTVGKL